MQLYYYFLLASVAHKAYDASKPLPQLHQAFARQIQYIACYVTLTAHRAGVSNVNLHVKPTPILLYNKLRKVDSLAVLAFCLSIASQLDIKVNSEWLSSRLAWDHMAPAQGVADEKRPWCQLDLLSRFAGERCFGRKGFLRNWGCQKNASSMDVLMKAF